MNLTIEEVQKMKVVELKAELQQRGLSAQGVKAVLVDRLIAALTVAQDEGGGVGGNELIGNGGVPDTPVVQEMKVEAVEIKPVSSPVKAPSPVKQMTMTPPIITDSPVVKAVQAPVAAVVSSPVRSPPVQSTPIPTSALPANIAVRIPSSVIPAVQAQPAPTPAAIPVQQPKVEKKEDGVVKNDVVKTEAMDTTESEASAANKRKLEATEDKQEVKKIKTEARVVPEDEPEFNQQEVLLDWHKSDLNLKISKDTFLEAEPIISDEFPFAYGGAKATSGFTQGKIFFELKFLKAMSVRADFGDLEFKHILRVGWSDLLTGLQLGQEKFSYGYESKGKLYKGGEIVDFGENLVEGDVVAAYIDIGSDFVELKFSKNGKLVGDALEIPKAEVEGKTWFPHILVRNVKFSVNFGSSDPAFPPVEGYTFAGKVDPSLRVRGPNRPDSRSDCELIMLVGLACSGKTTWAKEYVKNNPEKNYIILGTSTVVERSVKDPSVITAPKGPKAYEGFMNRAGKFVEKLVDLAPSRRRNYILDQSNVLPSVQRRKCGGFEGFRRRAVVILPSDEEYQKRIKAKEQEQGKSVPKSTLLDMKASFQLPEVGELFSEVEFPELPKDDAEKLVETYNKEGADAGYGRSGSGKGSQRGGYFGRGGGRGGFNHHRGRGGGFMRGGPRGHPPRGPGMMMRGPPRPPMRGPPPFRGRGMGPPPPPVRPPRGGPMNGTARFGPPRPVAPPARGVMRGPPPHHVRGPPPSRGPPPAGSWQRAAGPSGYGAGGGAQRAPQRNQMRGNGGGPRWTPPSKPMQNMNRPPPPQVWQQQAPPQQQQQQNVWNTASGFGNFGGQQDQQPQQAQHFANPWAQHQQVPDQGFGRSWDSMGNNNNNMGMNAMQGNPVNRAGNNNAGSWQGYGGQQFGGGGGYGGGRR